MFVFAIEEMVLPSIFYSNGITFNNLYGSNIKKKNTFTSTYVCYQLYKKNEVKKTPEVLPIAGCSWHESLVEMIKVKRALFCL